MMEDLKLCADVAFLGYAAAKKENEQLRAKLQESQAREMKLREAISEIPMGYALDASFESVRKCREALAQPQDNTALQELIEKIERRTIERCAVAAWMFYDDMCKAKNLNPHHHGEWISSTAIRALPTGNLKLEDLK